MFVEAAIVVDSKGSHQQKLFTENNKILFCFSRKKTTLITLKSSG
jgi:hypothetical protein